MKRSILVHAGLCISFLSYSTSDLLKLIAPNFDDSDMTRRMITMQGNVVNTCKELDIKPDHALIAKINQFGVVTYYAAKTLDAVQIILQLYNNRNASSYIEWFDVPSRIIEETHQRSFINPQKATDFSPRMNESKHFSEQTKPYMGFIVTGLLSRQLWRSLSMPICFAILYAHMIHTYKIVV